MAGARPSPALRELSVWQERQEAPTLDRKLVLQYRRMKCWGVEDTEEGQSMVPKGEKSSSDKPFLRTKKNDS